MDKIDRATRDLLPGDYVPGAGRIVSTMTLADGQIRLTWDDSYVGIYSPKWVWYGVEREEEG